MINKGYLKAIDDLDHELDPIDAAADSADKNAASALLKRTNDILIDVKALTLALNISGLPEERRATLGGIIEEVRARAKQLIARLQDRVERP